MREILPDRRKNGEDDRLFQKNGLRGFYLDLERTRSRSRKERSLDVIKTEETRSTVVMSQELD